MAPQSTNAPRPSSKTPPPRPPALANAKTPPEWRSERFFKKLNIVPAAIKRVLDQLAKLPVLKYFFALFTSVWFGISLIFLIGLYVGIGSGFANLRAYMEMTDLQFFDAMPMRILIGLLALNLSIVTLRRIPLTLYKAGVWTVHIGILTLLTGCVWYFSQKTEGSVRIYLNQTVDHFYDATQRALYVYKINPDGTPDLATSTMTPLPDLPIYNEYYAANGNPLNMPIPAAALTSISPALSNASLQIVGYYPYAGLGVEWLPDPDINPADPESAKLPPGRHAVLIRAHFPDGRIEGKYFVPTVPAERVFDSPDQPISIEYLHDPSAEELANIEADIPGPVGLTVRIPKLHITKTFAAPNGTPIPIEGSSYTVTAGDVGEMELISKGYEGASSDNILIHVVRKNPDGSTFAFNRMVLSHYPEVSPDFITEPDGKQKRIQERVDNDIQITFHDNQRDQIWVVENSAAPSGQQFTLFHRNAGGGKTESFPMQREVPVDVSIAGIKVQFVVLNETDHAVEVTHPEIVPPEERKRGQTAMDAMQFSVVELALSRGPVHDKPLFVPFVQFAEIGPRALGRGPTTVNLPGFGKIAFLLSTTRRQLPNSVKLTNFQAVKYPGANNMYQDYISTIQVTDKNTGKTETLTAQLNDPAHADGNYYFQSGWDGNQIPGVRFSILGVGNRPGLKVMIIGAFLIFIGIGYAFYIKPILLKAKKKFLANWAANKSSASP